MLNHRYRVCVGVMLAAALAVTACGSDDGDGTASTPASSPITESTASTAVSTTDSSPESTDSPVQTTDPSATSVAAALACGGQPQGGTLRVGANLQEFGGPFFDPALRSSIRSAVMWMDAIYDDMIHTGPDGTLVPGLAEAWNIPDSKTIELTLRQGVKFQDGTDFNADAVKFSYDRAKAATETAGSPANLENLESVEVVDENHVVIHLTNSDNALWMDRLLVLGYSDAMAITSPTAVAKAGDDYNSQPVGAGPYVFDSYDVDQVVRLKANPDYWDKDNPPCYDTVEFVHVEPGAPALAALQSGSIDMVPNLGANDLATADAIDGAHVQSQETNGVYMVHLSSAFCNSALEDPNLRRAVALAIDRDALSKVLQGNITVTPLRFGPESPNYYQDLADQLAYNPEEAKKLVAAANITKPLILVSRADPTNSALAQTIQAQLAAVGLDVEVQTIDDSIDAAERLNPMYVNQVSASAIFSYFGPERPLNVCNYKNDTMFDNFAIANDNSASDADRKAAWRIVEEELVKDLPTIFLGMRPVFTVYKDNVQGIGYLGEDALPSIRNAYSGG